MAQTSSDVVCHQMVQRQNNQRPKVRKIIHLPRNLHQCLPAGFMYFVGAIFLLRSQQTEHTAAAKRNVCQNIFWVYTTFMVHQNVKIYHKNRAKFTQRWHPYLSCCLRAKDCLGINITVCHTECNISQGLVQVIRLWRSGIISHEGLLDSLQLEPPPPTHKVPVKSQLHKCA